ncbi:uncharacterized protein LOC132544940 [Ylistrum balloti]|uniref:uncharacterized protein LOC132544940 n=1 Tax=Ylistrum balloti TaxID=509963 RepID=UPI0029057F4B|nr:uncharacterized protein LOC132544940 [Ylistrum balloti]
MEGHKRGKKTRNDKVVPIKQADRHNDKVVPEVCKTHPGKTCDLFCTECKVVMCSMCFTKKHKQHAFKHLEEELDSSRQYIRDQLKTLKAKLNNSNSKISKRQRASIKLKHSVKIIREDVQARGTKLKTEVDSVVKSVLKELSLLADEEEKLLTKDCQSEEKNIKDIKQLIKDVEQQSKRTSRQTLLDLMGRLRTAVQRYDDEGKIASPQFPSYVAGKIDTEQLKTMIGQIQVGHERSDVIPFKKEEVDNLSVQKLCTFQAKEQSYIMSICPIDGNYSWISQMGFHDLFRTNKLGKTRESIKLGFKPESLALTNTAELLMTCQDGSPLIYKLSHNRQVTIFADISPLKAWNITVSENDEVFVSTDTTTILALNTSGHKIKQLSCGQERSRVVCLTAGNVAVSTGQGLKCEELNIVDQSGQITHKWSGDLENGEKIKETDQYSIASDKSGRIFVPDVLTNQVYVLQGNEMKAKCLLDKTCEIAHPWTVSVDRCGHAWIGCSDGTIHVVQL